MPAYQIQRVEPQEERFIARPGKVMEELAACEGIRCSEKNKLQGFLLEMGIWSIAEMDYPLRRRYEEYLTLSQGIQRSDRYIQAYDRVKQYSIREQMQTLAGRQQCEWQLRDEILFIPYHSNQALAMEFDTVRNRSNMVWDFTRPCPQSLKQQIFSTLNAILETAREKRRREHKLTGLQMLYDFCAEQQIADINKIELWQEKAFESFLEERTGSESRQMQLLRILNFSRKTIFLQSGEIRWDANIWYMERLKLPKHRINPSASFSSVSFIEIEDAENRRYAKGFLKYQIGITGQAVSTMLIKFAGIRNFLVWLGDAGQNVCQSTTEQLDRYIKTLQGRNIMPKTFNEYLTGLYQFYQFLVVRGYMARIPFQIEYYQKKILPKHHDRSVSPETYTEILSQLHLLPEHLRCMYLHLWSLGLRISEVCTLKGDAYYWQGEDAWIQVYQIKMKNYKRIPISEGLYKIMQVYIRRHNIGPDDYLFTNQKGGPYNSGTFRGQMKKFCEERGIEGGDYLFQSHDYRHTVATLFYDNGVSLQSVRDYLGHKHEEMTQQYVDYVPMKIAKESEEFFKNQGDSGLATCLRKGGKHGR